MKVSENYLKQRILKKLKILFLFLLFFNSEAFSIETKIIVKIDNKIITNIDILNEVNYLKVLNPNLDELDKDRIFQIAKNSLIRESIKEIEISKINNVEIETEYLENVITNIYQQIGLKNRDEFTRYIKSNNIDLKTIEKKLSNEALWNRLIYKKFISKVKIDEKKIKEEIRKTNRNINSYLLNEIAFSVDQNEKLIELFNRIKISIKENGFENTASIFSLSDTARTGGNLGWVNEGSIDKNILNKLQNLNIGEFTNPIVIPGGFVILFLKDRKEINQKIDFNSEFSTRVRNSQNQQLNHFSIVFFNKIKKDINIYEK